MAATPPATPHRPVRRRPPVRISIPTRRSPSSSLSPTPIGPPDPYNSHTVAGRRMIKWRDDPEYPSILDQWIQANISLWPRADPRLPITGMFSDEVLCKLKKVYRPYKNNPDPNEIFADDTENFVLVLTISLPPESGVLVWWQESPPAILERFDGYIKDPFAPDWCKIMDEGEEICFKQPRGIISDFFAWLAMEPINVAEELSEPMLRWAEAVSIVRQARLTIKSDATYSRLAMFPTPRLPRTPSRRAAWPYEYSHRTRSIRFRDVSSSGDIPRMEPLALGTPVDV